MKKPKQKNASEFRQTFLNNIEILIKSINIANLKTSNIQIHILKSLSNVNSCLVNIIVEVTQPMGNFSISVLTKKGNYSLNLDNISTIGNEFSSDSKEFPIGTICVQNPNPTINSNLLLQEIFHNQNQSTSTKLTALNSQTQTFVGNYKISDLEKRAFQNNIISTSVIKIIKSSTLKTN